MYRDHRAIDVAMMAAGTMADLTAVDKTVTAAKEGHLAGKTEDVRQTVKLTASQVAWVRHESRPAHLCGRVRRGVRSVVALSARAPHSVARHAREAHLPLGVSMIDRWVIPARSDQSKGEGN